MGVFIVILLIIGFVIMLVRDNYKLNAEEEKKAEWRKKCGIEVIETYECSYYGGFNDIGSVDYCTVDMMKEKIKLSFCKTGTNGFAKVKYIMFSNIEEVSIKTSTEIKEQVSLGKLICFGILAFGMEGNKKEITNDVVVLTVRDGEKTNSILLKCDNTEDLRKSLNIEKINCKQKIG